MFQNAKYIGNPNPKDGLKTGEVYKIDVETKGVVLNVWFLEDGCLKYKSISEMLKDWDFNTEQPNNH